MSRARGTINIKQAFSEGQVSQEVFCDACGKTATIDPPITRSQAQQYQICQKCGSRSARPIVYYYCMSPECCKALIKVANVVVQDGRPSAGDPIVCPVCGQEDTVTPMEIDLKRAKEIARETGQDFP
jgi:hypothetical protein